MNLKQALADLEAAGTAQNRKVFARHGVNDPQFGVSFANLDKLRKKVGSDTALAAGLWETGNHDARVLAAKVADPKVVEEARLEAWAADLDNYVVTDALSALAGRTPYAAVLMRRWITSDREWVGAAGWNLVAHLAMKDAAKSGVPDAELADLLGEIESRIHDALNRVRDSMNNALIAIGSYRPALTDRALKVAAAIGEVEVDHGETGCKTPDAGPYIEKTRSHLEKKAAKAGKKG